MAHCIVRGKTRVWIFVIKSNLSFSSSHWFTHLKHFELSWVGTFAAVFVRLYLANWELSVRQTLIFWYRFLSEHACHSRYYTARIEIWLPSNKRRKWNFTGFLFCTIHHVVHASGAVLRGEGGQSEVWPPLIPKWNFLSV